MNTPEQQEFLQSLLNTAIEAGIQCQHYPGGMLVFSPAEYLKQFPGLAAQLRENRQALARYISATGAESTEDRSWLLDYARMAPPASPITLEGESL